MNLYIILICNKFFHNWWQLKEVGDFEAQNCLPPLNPARRDTKLHLTTEPSISFKHLLSTVILSFSMLKQDLQDLEPVRLDLRHEVYKIQLLQDFPI